MRFNGPGVRTGGRRFLFVRQFNAEQRKEPLQPDLSGPLGYYFDFKVVITNRKDSLTKSELMHEGRGAQEVIFAELKSENALDYVPRKTWLSSRAFMCAVLIAHNLARQLTMLSEETTGSFRDANVRRYGPSPDLTPYAENSYSSLGALLALKAN